MSEFCFSSTFKTHFYSLLISDLMISFGSFIFSHPLYFSYFIFFSPYLLKLISFLSPLFITTFLLSLSLLTLIPSFYKNFAAEPSTNDDEHEEFHCMEDLELYKIVFGESEIDGKEIPVEVLEEKSEVSSSHEDSSSISKSEAFTGNLEENSVLMEKLEEKRLEDFLKVLDEFETMTSNVEVKKVEPTWGTKADELVEKEKEKSLTRNGSKTMDNVTDDEKEYNSKIKACDLDIDYTDNGGEYTSKVKSFESQNLGTYGSMRKEKEWKRTLACKLFEERRNVDGGEGMDSLWETYEMDSDKSKPKNNTKKKTNDKIKNQNQNKNKNKKSEIHLHEQDENDIDDGQLCCLQALKFSAGKMNLGIGRPNVVRNISKAIKGIGWLHNVSRQGKKVHHNGGDKY
ncbi:Hypothetical predicted protein [Olea europaea subsp. europaea]|uniref:Uncharacterized protein n=1 Tax=Olea europaea subsp. europaea TaxID=158383 RepID=A0A8S0RB32_OLEEU|nr:Hypothetical predicted protein [Olea europaea subsp. europaea]